jgi:hypothetical protein
MIMLLLPSFPIAENEREPDGLQLLDFLIGSWQGTADDAGGVATGERKFRLILNGEFIHIHNRIIYDASVGDSAGRVREDWGIMSIDDAKETLILRQFSDDGAVTRYEADSVVGQEEITIYFVSTNIENDPGNSWARLTIAIPGPDKFTELLERGNADGVVTERLESSWVRK